MKELSTARLLEIATAMLSQNAPPPFTALKRDIHLSDILTDTTSTFIEYNSEDEFLVSLLTNLAPDKTYFVDIAHKTLIINHKEDQGWFVCGDEGPRRLTTAYGLTDLARDLFIKKHAQQVQMLHVYSIEEAPLIAAAHSFIASKRLSPGELSRFPCTFEGIAQHFHESIRPSSGSGEEKQSDASAAASSHGLFSGKASHEAPKLQQDCAEKMVIAIARIKNPKLAAELEKKFTEAYAGKQPSDKQIELDIFFLCQGVKNQIRSTWGESEEALIDGLKKLNKSETYFLRTGMNMGPGHFQALYHDNGWHIFSTQSNFKQITNNNDQLTSGAESLLVRHKGWGQGNNEYSFSLTPCTPDMLEPLANFIIETRISKQARTSSP